MDYKPFLATLLLLSQFPISNDAHAIGWKTKNNECLLFNLYPVHVFQWDAQEAITYTDFSIYTRMEDVNGNKPDVVDEFSFTTDSQPNRNVAHILVFRHSSQRVEISAFAA